MAVACLSLPATACRNDPAQSTRWIQGSESERWAQMEQQLRGLDVAMVEIGYRYQELYWAGEDGNWEFAAYQVRKIQLSLERALERRPKRRASAQQLFLPATHSVEESASLEDRVRFRAAFAEMTEACNACHRAEGVASFHVVPPIHRPSPIRSSPTPASDPQARRGSGSVAERISP